MLKTKNIGLFLGPLSFFLILFHSSTSLKSAMLSHAAMRKTHGGKFVLPKVSKLIVFLAAASKQQASKPDLLRRKTSGGNFGGFCGGKPSAENVQQKIRRILWRKTFSGKSNPTHCKKLFGGNSSAENRRRTQKFRHALKQHTAEKPSPENLRWRNFSAKS